MWKSWQRAGGETQVRVYSNQPEVSLYLNGNLAARLTGDKVFVFTVALEQGGNVLVADAGCVRDSISLEKVEKEPEIYVLPEINERAEGVANWFSAMGDMDLKASMEFPEGRYSIRDTMEEFAKTSEAMELVAKAVKLATNFTVEPGKGMWNMMRTMSPEKLMGMMSGLAPEGFLESLNMKLNQIEKP